MGIVKDMESLSLKSISSWYTDFRAKEDKRRNPDPIYTQEKPIQKNLMVYSFGRGCTVVKSVSIVKAVWVSPNQCKKQQGK